MKLKIFTALLLSTAISVVTPLNAKAGEGCSKYPFKTEEAKFVPSQDGTFRLIWTKETQLSSADYEEVGLALFEAELLAELAIKEFIATKVDEKKDLDFAQILSQKAYGIIKVGSCYEPKKFVRVSLGISSKTNEAHKEDFPYLLDRTPINLPWDD